MPSGKDPLKRVVALKLEGLSSIKKIARFLGTQDIIVNQLLEDGRLGGVMIANLRRRGVQITPGVKNTVETVVRGLDQYVYDDDSELSRAHILAREATATIIFTDIVASTALTERLGDRQARSVFRDHSRIIRSRTREHGGVEVKSMGDGFMLTFRSARRAVSCAVAAQRDLQEYNLNHPETPVSVRMGMSVGEPIREEEDLFGKAVVLAARISAEASGGQILACQIVHALVVHSGEFAFRSLGSFELKGISGAQLLYEVAWR
jgi:class 3 adenylate cyclase